MTQYRVTTRKALDGVDARLPAIAECEAWGRTEDEAIDRLMERVAYFLDLSAAFKHVLDKSHVEDGMTFYTLIIKTESPGKEGRKT